MKPHELDAILARNPALSCSGNMAVKAGSGLQTTKPAQPSPPLGYDNEGKAQSTRRAIVRFTLRRVSLLDVDAKYGVIKDLLDGLWISHLIPGDREDQISLEVIQEKQAHYKDEKTIIEITYP